MVSKTSLDKLAPRLVDCDNKLYKLLSQLELLQYINPINAEKERLKFFRNRYYYEPDFRYPKCQVRLDKIRKSLNQIKVQKIEHPLARLLYEQTVWYFNGILDCIGTVGQGNLFLHSSLKTFGSPSHQDLKIANLILNLSPASHSVTESEWFSTKQAAEYMRAYNQSYGFDVRVEEVTHISSKAMVSNRIPAVYLRKNQKFSKTELIALSNHEIGVHLVTTFNAHQQPLRLFQLGLPFNVETQEGLAVLSEYYSGSLTLDRLRELALRVILADRVSKSYSFSSSFDLLTSTYKMDRDTAFKMVTRLYRGGGFTKDRLYLSGLYQLLTHGDLPLEWLLAGKTTLAYIDLVRELNEEIPVLRPLVHSSLSFENHLGIGTPADKLIKTVLESLKE